MWSRNETRVLKVAKPSLMDGKPGHGDRCDPARPKRSGNDQTNTEKFKARGMVNRYNARSGQRLSV
jgi:hypothetical protein